MAVAAQKRIFTRADICLAVGCIVGLAFTGMSCSKSKSSSASFTPDYIHLKGELVGAPAGVATRILLEGRSEPVVVASDNGTFSFTLADKELGELRQKQKDLLGDLATGEFRLIAVATAGEKYMGGSQGVSFDFRGTQDLGKIRMDRPATVSGQIEVQKPDGEFEGRKGISVTGFSGAAITDDKGFFAVTDLIPGKQRILLSGPSIQTQFKEIEVGPGAAISLESPWRLFQNDIITGSFAMLPPAQPADLVRQGIPFRRSFAVSASPSAKFVRMSHTSEQLATMQWRALSDKLNYDFLGNGSHTLFYQFGGADQAKVSDTFTLTVPVDIFSDSRGCSIGDGSGVSVSKRILVHFAAPSAAVEVRISEKQSDLAKDGGLPWRKLVPTLEHFLDVTAPARSNLTREIFCQYRAADGTPSSLYSATTVLQPFPPQLNPFQIEGGAAETGKRLVRIDVQLPENAHELRIYEEIVSGGTTVGGVLIQVPNRTQITDTYIKAQPSFDFLFLIAGRKTLFLQYRDIDGLESPIFKQQIFVLPLPPGGPGFSVNGDAPSALSRDLSIKLLPPPSTVGFHISESLREIETLPYLNLREQISFRASRIGLVTVYVQYVDINNDESLIYSREIFVDPFNGDVGSFVINGGAPITDKPRLTLDILPPLAATSMLVSLSASPGVCSSSGGGGGGGFGGGGGGGQSFGGGSDWQPVARFAELLAPIRGVVGVCVKFRTINEEESNTLHQSIVYEPFPLPGAVEINGGAVAALDRELRLTITAPPNAVKMRLGLKIPDQGVLWQPYRAVEAPVMQVPFTLPRELPIGTDWPTGTTQEIFVQFATPQDEPSVPVSDSIYLDLFPIETRVITINNGDATTNNSNVTIKFTPPPAAVGIKIVNNSPSTFINWEQVPIIAIPANQALLPMTVPFKLQGCTTIRFIQAIYITASGEESLPFGDSIDVVTPSAMAINNGDPTTNSPNISLNLTVPDSAVGIYIAEGSAPTDFGSLIQLSSNPLSYTLIDQTIGIKTLTIKFQISGCADTPVVSDTIELTP